MKVGKVTVEWELSSDAYDKVKHLFDERDTLTDDEFWLAMERAFQSRPETELGFKDC